VKRRIVLLGPPASGKGTQAELMKARYALPVTSPGAMLREERRRGTPLGLDAEKLTSQGSLLPDATIVQLVEAWLEQNDASFIFDGFPRSLGQADALQLLLERKGAPLQAAISLDAPLEILQARVAGRLVCLSCGQIVAVGLHVPASSAPCPACGGELGRRSDDTPEVLARRLEEYRQKSEPVLAYYADRHLLYRIDSSGTPASALAAIAEIVEAA
jgi:adenylate kinase